MGLLCSVRPLTPMTTSPASLRSAPTTMAWPEASLMITWDGRLSSRRVTYPGCCESPRRSLDVWQPGDLCAGKSGRSSGNCQQRGSVGWCCRYRTESIRLRGGPCSNGPRWLVCRRMRWIWSCGYNYSRDWGSKSCATLLRALRGTHAAEIWEKAVGF